MLYPLTFHPIFKERVWGGRKLELLYHKPLPPDTTIGESWEISDRPGDVSVIANGPLAGKDLRWLMQQHERAVRAEDQERPGRRMFSSSARATGRRYVPAERPRACHRRRPGHFRDSTEFGHDLPGVRLESTRTRRQAARIARRKIPREH